MDTGSLSFTAKIPYYVQIGWGILVLFAFIGVLFGKSDVAVPLAVIIAVMWVMLKIVFEAFAATLILWAFSIVKAEKNKDDKDDKHK